MYGDHHHAIIDRRSSWIFLDLKEKERTENLQKNARLKNEIIRRSDKRLKPECQERLGAAKKSETKGHSNITSISIEDRIDPKKDIVAHEKTRELSLLCHSTRADERVRAAIFDRLIIGRRAIHTSEGKSSRRFNVRSSKDVPRLHRHNETRVSQTTTPRFRAPAPLMDICITVKPQMLQL